ncbi:MAG: FKBP-type peptidyl-prolyl cis-trans isomerase, partial [Cytophagaceae bacterium]
MRIFFCCLFFYLIASAQLSAQQFSEQGYKKTAGGLRYKILADSSGTAGEEDGYVVFHFIMKNNKQEILRNTFKEGSPIASPINKPAFKGSLEEGFRLLSQGDSASFLVNADSLFEKSFQMPLP